MSKSRTKNSARNASVAIISKILYIIMSFVCRTIFIKILGTEYLGVNGLFSNILTVLSLAELGLGTAIIYKMYKPVAKDEHERIKTLLHFYKKVYSVIGITVLILGLLVVPFIGKIVKNPPSINENLTLIYILFLMNSSISYFFAFKKSIITAHQNEYIITIIDFTITIILDILQIIILYTTHNYIAYLTLQIIATMSNNLIMAKIANHMYPYIKEKKYKKMSKKESRNIFKDVKSLIFYQFGAVVSGGTDNIIISRFLGVAQVGLLSNYTTITSAIISLLNALFSGLTASIGNLNTIKEKERKESVFYQIMFILFIVYGYVSIAMTLLINKFITIWLGQSYILGTGISMALGFNFYIDGMRYVYYTYRNTLGLFKKGRFLPLITALANIILSVILVKYIGMFGVLIATGITKLFIMSLSFEPYFIHKNAFGSSSLKYYKLYIYYFAITILAFIISGAIISIIPLQGILGFIVDALVITVIVAIIFIIATCKTEQFAQTKERLNGIIGKFKKSN